MCHNQYNALYIDLHRLMEIHLSVLGSCHQLPMLLVILWTYPCVGYIYATYLFYGLRTKYGIMIICYIYYLFLSILKTTVCILNFDKTEACIGIALTFINEERDCDKIQ